MMKTTLLTIKKNSPCEEGWRKLRTNLGVEGTVTKANDRGVSLLEILDSNGPWDTLWAFRCVDGFDREKRLVGCYMARCVLPLYEDRYPGDSRVRDCIDVAERFAEGQATDEERAAAGDAAWDAAGAAAGDAARDAARAVARGAAWAVARGAARDAARAALETYLRAMLTDQPLPEPYKFWEQKKEIENGR